MQSGVSLANWTLSLAGIRLVKMGVPVLSKGQIKSFMSKGMNDLKKNL